LLFAAGRLRIWLIFDGGPAPNDGMFNLRGQSPIWCGMGNLVAFWRGLVRIRAIQLEAGVNEKEIRIS